ncbi:recombinase family protein [Tsukamurella paurometabola]|uniref:recombinase family protein n=1 Tax=Tsukamurella paurometabola TaxID=2061 RepID=UPI0018D552B3|nr:recombinase family protein [Tsukamurella paurometabola]
MLDQGIDTCTPVGRMFLHILGAVAEFEHALLSERTKDGLAAARARGRTGGRSEAQWQQWFSEPRDPGRESFQDHGPGFSCPHRRGVSIDGRAIRGGTGSE